MRADIATGAIALDGYARVNARALARAMSGHRAFRKFRRVKSLGRTKI